MTTLSNMEIKGVGDYIVEKLEKSGWTQEDLANILDISVKTVNQIIAHKQTLSFEIARLLENVLDKTAEELIKIDAEFHLKVQREKSDRENAVKMRAEIYANLPVGEMIKKGWLKATNDISELEKQVKAFIGQSNKDTLNFDAWQVSKKPLYRKGGAEKHDEKSLKTWLQMALNLCDSFNTTNSFNTNELDKIANSLHQYTIHLAEGVESFLDGLVKAGVIFIYLPHLPKTFVSGATFWFENKPVIVYTARYKRYDNFWFTMAHEISHILLHGDNDNYHLIDEIESQADGKAENLLQKDNIMQFFRRNMRYITDEKIVECAEKYQVHPSIVCGSLAYEKAINFARLHKFNKDILEMIPKKYWAENHFVVS